MFSITKKMKKIYCVIYGKYRKFEKALVFYIICSVCKNENVKLFKEEESI